MGSGGVWVFVSWKCKFRFSIGIYFYENKMLDFLWWKMFNIVNLLLFVYLSSSVILIF